MLKAGFMWYKSVIEKQGHFCDLRFVAVLVYQYIILMVECIIII